ncbi:tail fiber domain-containing protein [Pseudomonas nitroreducens]|uniref:Tail fiber domain-containing protein n=2 Tax=Pseudomonas nitroreducens TaxID=46680 RepID=A0A6G6J2F1_PSENT|nr:tail fiber domain-containing protein [Pseudomonas nitroreducens]QIE89442.1 tail fiber domain-containing protein [Pseudomonas nitroreducens]
MPWYSAGTVAVTNNSPTVTGTGTTFAANARVGDAFRGPDGLWYEVTNVASATVISIKPNYQGANSAAGSYAIAPMQGYVKDSADALRGFVNQYGTLLASIGPWSTAASPADARIALGLGPIATWQSGQALSLPGSGVRLQADFSSASLANRMMLQTSTANALTAVGVLPNGTARVSLYNVFNGSDPANASYGQLYVDSDAVRLVSGASGAGANLPLSLYTAGVERVRLQTSSNGVINFFQNASNNPISERLPGVMLNQTFGVYAYSNNSALNVGTGGNNLLGFYYNGLNAVGTITTNGTSTAYNTSSDYRLKQEIQDADADAAWRNLDGYRIRSYAYKTDPGHRIRFGGIAHELAEVNPDMVTGEKDAAVGIGTLYEVRSIGIILGDDNRVLAHDVEEPPEGRWIETGTHEFVAATDVEEPDEISSKQRWVKTEERMQIQGVDWSKLVPELVLNLQTAKRMIQDLRSELDEVRQKISA